MTSSALPDELWSRILEIGVHSRNFTFKDLCCLSITSARFRRLSSDEDLWSHLLSSDFPVERSRLPLPSSSFKSSYKFRFERDREKKIAAKRRAVLSKQSEIAEHLGRVKELASCLAEEKDRLTATLAELSSLNKIRQASVALNVWQPEVVRGRHMQIVEQSALPVDSRVHALEMELKLCRQQICSFEIAYNEEKRRFDIARKELKSIKYHPFGLNEPTSGVKGGYEFDIW